MARSSIGEDAMVYLLTETSLFVSLPNRCLCQIAGEPVIHLVPSLRDVTQSSKMPEVGADSIPKKRPFARPDGEAGKPSTKRRKIKSGSRVSQMVVPTKRLAARLSFVTSSNNIRSSPADISFTRVRLFYSKPNYIPHTNLIVVGLPLKRAFFSQVVSDLSLPCYLIDFLNRLYPSFSTKAYSKRGLDNEDPRQTAENVRQLSKYVFARQYGLNTPFASTVSKGSTFKLGDYLDREAEIKVWPSYFLLFRFFAHDRKRQLAIVRLRNGSKMYYLFWRSSYVDMRDADTCH